ncbi:hypothetical protein PT181_06755 [Erysipelothrix rhusiopathiae]|nr:hypothetical protein [Erysipelothrix rhusiopathiae]MDE8148150.1 hypothetical protein [Erysipelothrix rhusiopathiae]MDE8195450.1 hypothetical protein [Erysipelothrix rhusiopathiae]MDE8204700.1 hypothetical protein [Erysipelothrix rhusiopathiae]MDE8213002.1 hypothetical protein [Erysipelothrix rhusiopathiae]
MIQNEPRVGVGAMIMQEGEVLLVLRKKVQKKIAGAYLVEKLNSMKPWKMR